MPTPADVLADVLRSDPGRPRITCYDDSPGPTQGERIELSARVVVNWVNKAANALQEEWDCHPGTTVRLDLPPHWRTVYWAMAVWQVGGCVAVDQGPRDLVVTSDPRTAADAEDAVLVTLAALARSAALPVPAGVVDEARQMSSYGDTFMAFTDPADSDPALRTGNGTVDHGTVVPVAAWPTGSRIHTRGDAGTARFLRTVLAAWAMDGSVVLSRGAATDVDLSRRLRSEGVTHDLG